MTYGAATWDAHGNVQMTTDDFTYQVIHNQLYDLATASTLHIEVPGFDPDKCVACVLPIDPPDAYRYPRNALPFVGVAVGRIDIARRNPTHPIDPTLYSLLRFRLLIMRYRN